MSKLMVVEDDANIAELLEFMLTRAGHTVTLVADGEAAFERITKGEPPDLVVLDSMLPYREGPELLGILREQAAWQHVPVVMLTAKSLDRDVAAAFDAGATEYIVKPFQPHEFIELVNRLLRTPAHAHS
jgi:DNA-binding response OmpR family regulator